MTDATTMMLPFFSRCCLVVVVVVFVNFLIFVHTTDAFLVISTTTSSSAVAAPPQRCLAAKRRTTQTTTTTTATTTISPVITCMQGDETDLMMMMMPSVGTPFVVATIALGLGIAAQSFINQMLEGDQGLGAFLKDGSGYNQSGFRVARPKSPAPQSQAEEEKFKDPLPWLKLPKLDFVEVAGQSDTPLIVSRDMQQQSIGIGTSETSSSTVVDDTSVYEDLEQLRLRLNREVQEENIAEARKLQMELERRMKREGIEFFKSTTRSVDDTTTNTRQSTSNNNNNDTGQDFQ